MPRKVYKKNNSNSQNNPISKLEKLIDINSQLEVCTFYIYFLFRLPRKMSRPTALVWACLLWYAAIGSSFAASSYNHYRLPTSVRPEHYRLEIATHLDDHKGFDFSGLVEITLNVFENANNITLHATNLTIDQTLIQIKNLDDVEQNILLDSIEVNPKHDYYIMKLSKPLVKNGRYLLKMPFKAELNKNLFGYYRSVYTDKTSGERR